MQRLSDRWVSITLSVLLHAALLGALVYGWLLFRQPPRPAPTLAMVAPGISEALVATAIGLFAAIPAVVAYNRFADQVTRLEMRFDAFIEEFSTILQRHAARAGGPER